MFGLAYYYKSLQTPNTVFVGLLSKQEGKKTFQASDFINVRGGEASEAKYIQFNFFFDNFIPCVAGCKVWDNCAKVRCRVSLSGLVSITDEAFTELCIKNYFAKWTQPGAGTTWTEDRGGNCNYQGWSRTVYAKFDSICKRIVKQRQEKESEELEDMFICFAHHQYGLNGDARCKCSSRGDVDALELYNDLP